MPISSANTKAPTVRVSVAPPLSRMMSVTGRLSDSVLPKSSRDDLAEVLQVLHQQRAVEAQGLPAAVELLLAEPAADRRR